MSEDVDKILNELKNKQPSAPSSEENADQMLEKIQEERRSKVDNFKLNLDLEEPDGQTGADPASAVIPDSSEPKSRPVPPAGDYAWVEGEKAPSPAGKEEPRDTGKATPAGDEKTAEKTKGQKKKEGSKVNWKVLTSVIYGVLVLGVSIGLACFLIVGAIDMLGFNKSEQKIDIVIPEGATTQEIAQELKEKGIIDHPFIFALYSKVMGKDGTYKPHGEDNPVTLSADMGYNGIIAQLQSGQAREVVSVTIPEGYTVEDIAKTLEENGVCAASDFYTSMREDEFDYDFLEGIPENGADESENRLYRMEGYLFPDTYEFYTGSSAKSVITKFLDNFESKISIETTNRPDEYKQLWSKMHSCMQERGVTLDQIITLASLIQAEASGDDDMAGISRVLWNRLDNPDRFPRLECDSTWNYINNIVPQPDTVTPQQEAYYTYVRQGLPVGPICNPGLAAIEAAVEPASEVDGKDITGCFYFAHATVSGEPITLYARTQEEHDRNRQRYNIY